MDSTAAPILGVLVLISPILYFMYTKFQLRKMELMARLTGQNNEPMLAKLEALNTEVAGLRDTSTQYDISLQHRLDELAHRLETVETKTRTSSFASQEEEAVQLARGGRG